MSKIIECQVNDEYVLGSGVVVGAAGSYGDIYFKLKFNDTWTGLAIIATFKDALCTKTQVVMLMPSMLVGGEKNTYMVEIPAAALSLPGKARMTLTGYSTYSIGDDGRYDVFKDSQTNTATAFFRVLESDAAVPEDTEMGASAAEQLHSELIKLNNELETNIERIDEAVYELAGKTTELGDWEDNHERNASSVHTRIKSGTGAYSIRQVTVEEADVSGVGAVGLGYKVKTSGDYSAGFGAGGKASGPHAFVAGKDTEASGESSAAHGEYTRAKEKTQYVVGSFNEDEATARFIVGVGSNLGDRKNSFSSGLLKDGTKYFKVGRTMLTEQNVLDILLLLDEMNPRHMYNTLETIIKIQNSLIGGDSHGEN